MNKHLVALFDLLRGIFCVIGVVLIIGNDGIFVMIGAALIILSFMFR